MRSFSGSFMKVIFHYGMKSGQCDIQRLERCLTSNPALKMHNHMSVFTLHIHTPLWIGLYHYIYTQYICSSLEKNLTKQMFESAGVFFPTIIMKLTTGKYFHFFKSFFICILLSLCLFMNFKLHFIVSIIQWIKKPSLWHCQPLT